MKTKNLLFASLFLSLSLSGLAQTTVSGVYKTYSDYTNQKITFGIDCKTEKHKIKLHEFPNKPYITVVHDGTNCLKTVFLVTPLPLTMENLKKAFPDNHKFHDALTAQFKSDSELAAFDSFHKKSKLNHLLEMSRN